MDAGKLVPRPAWAALALIAAWVGCSQDLAGSRDSGVGDDDGFGGPAAGSTGIGGAAGTPMPMPPPEQEKESGFVLPVLSGRWVWAANPESNRVALVDTRSLAVELTHAGFAPKYLAALPVESADSSAAIVLNTRSHDATILHRTDAGITARSVPTHEGANALTVSPTGRFVIVWTDASALDAPDRAESFQDITIVDVEAARATRLGVGYRPSRVFLQEDEARAFVVCEPGISVVSLEEEPSVVQDVLLAEQPNEQVRDVAILPSGTHAIARVEGEPDVRIIDLESGDRTHVALSGAITDLDLTSDGSAAIAVVRGLPPGGSPPLPVESGAGGPSADGGSGEGGGGGEAASAGGGAGPGGNDPGATSEIALLPIPEAITDAESVLRLRTEVLVGSVVVSGSGSMAVFYSNATALDRLLVLSTDPSSPSFFAPRAVSLRAPVESVIIAPDARQAIVNLPRTGESSRAGAFGVVPLAAALPVKYQVTDAPVTGVAFAPSTSAHAIVTAAAGRTAYIVAMPSLRISPVGLPNLPLAAGIVAEEGQAFVVQSHPEGQLSLVDLETAAQRTLTGFELASEALQ